MGARPAELEPTNLKPPFLCAWWENSAGSLVKDCMGFEFFRYVFMQVL